MEEDANLEALRAKLHSGHPPIALVGAGASVPMGYPTWGQLIENLHAKLVAQPGDATATPATSGSQSAESWYSALKQFDKDPLWQAEAYEQALTEPVFSDFIRDQFGPKTPVKEPHRALAALPFRHYLTTNFDPCIQGALGARLGTAFSWSDQAQVSNFLRSLHTAPAKGPPSVVHLHGRYDDPASLVLTESAYVERYVVSDDARRKLLAIFLTHPVVFVGFSMDDPDLSQIMREVAARLGRFAPQGLPANGPLGAQHHFAIFGYRTRPEREAIRRRMEEKFGICVIFYQIGTLTDPADAQKTLDDHSGLDEVLARLAFPPGQAPPPTYARKEPTVVASDPQKNRWGGSPRAGGYVLDALQLDQETNKWVEFELTVKREDGRPFDGKVVFYLHDTFARSRVTVKARDGVARLKRWAYGAFTVGVEVEGGPCLELDLAECDLFPKWFRDR